MKNDLDLLAVPVPPYRKARLTATLASVQESGSTPEEIQSRINAAVEEGKRAREEALAVSPLIGPGGAPLRVEAQEPRAIKQPMEVSPQPAERNPLDSMSRDDLLVMAQIADQQGRDQAYIDSILKRAEALTRSSKIERAERDAYHALQESKLKFERGEIDGSAYKQAKDAFETAHVATEDEKRRVAGLPERTRSRTPLAHEGNNGFPTTEEVRTDAYRGKEYYQADIESGAHRDDFGGAPGEDAMKIIDKRFVESEEGDVVPPVPTPITPDTTPGPLPPVIPPVPPVRPPQPRMYKGGVVEAEGLVKAKALEAANVRLQEQQERMNGRNIFLRTGYGIWRRLWEPAMRQIQERREAKKIRDVGSAESANAYVGEGVADYAVQREENKATVERFLKEHDEYLQKGEERGNLPDGPIRTKFIDLIKEYATGAVGDPEFHIRKSEIIGELAGVAPEEINRSVVYAENLLDLARNVQEQLRHGETLADIDDRIDIVIGRAKYGPRTEVHRDLCDKMIGWLEKNPIGNKIVNELGVGIGLSVLYSSAVGFAEHSLRSVAPVLGVPALGAGLVAGVRERFRIGEQRTEIAREEASGRHTVKAEDTRRQEIIASLYGMESATSMRDNLVERVTRAGASSSPADFYGAVIGVAEISARLKLSEERKIDLVSYSDPKRIERERLDLLEAREAAVEQLRGIMAASGGAIVLPGGLSLEEVIDAQVVAHENRFITGPGGITERDAAFKQFRRKESLKTGAKTAAIALGAGLAVNELTALVRSDTDGLLERVFKGQQPGAKNQTVLRTLYERLTGTATPVSEALHPEALGAGVASLPEGTQLLRSPDGSIIFRDGTNYVSGLKIFPSGKFTQESLELLRSKGYDVSDEFHMITGAGTKVIEKETSEWMKMVGAQRFTGVRQHFDNMTKPFDLNELRLQYRGTGITPEGFQMDVSKMRFDGSFTGGVNADVPELIRRGYVQAFVSGTREHSNIGFPVNVGPDGLIQITEKAAKLFGVKDGAAQFKGGFIEFMVKPGATVEELAPLFKGDSDAVRRLLEKAPVFATVVGDHSVKSVAEVVPEAANVAVSVIQRLPGIAAIGMPGVTPAKSPVTAGIGVAQPPQQP